MIETPPTAAALAEELDEALVADVLTPRFPGAIDDEGCGFRAKYDRNWKAWPDQFRALGHHARTTTAAAFVAARRPALAAQVAAVARHGAKGLRERFWDAEHGGFFHRLTLDGAPAPERPDKLLRGQADALTALATLMRLPALTSDPLAVSQLARAQFEWIEARLRGGRRPGYLGAVSATGEPLPFDAESVAPPRAGGDPPVHWHDLNGHLRLLAAYTTLYEVTLQDDVGSRLAALVELLLGRFLAEPGCLHLALDAAGAPVPGEVSFGCDLAASSRLLAAADALGRGDEPAIRRAARRLAEHALAHGWDPHVGLWTGRGTALGRGRDLACAGWVPFEALATCAELAWRLPAARAAFTRAAHETWGALRERLRDQEQGGFWAGYDARGELQRIKGENWFAADQPARALIVAADRLRAFD